MNRNQKFSWRTIFFGMRREKCKQGIVKNLGESNVCFFFFSNEN